MNVAVPKAPLATIDYMSLVGLIVLALSPLLLVGGFHLVQFGFPTQCCVESTVSLVPESMSAWNIWDFVEGVGGFLLLIIFAVAIPLSYFLNNKKARMFCMIFSFSLLMALTYLRQAICTCIG